MLVVKKEDCSAGGRDVVEKREEGGIGWPAKIGIGSEGSGWRVVEGLPAVGAFEVADSDARGDTESPGLEDRRLAQERKIWIEVSWRMSSARSAQAKRVM